MSTIYITDPNASFKLQNKYLKVFQQERQRFLIRISNISQFIIFGNIKLPKDIVQIIRLNQIPVLYLTQTGEYIGRVENPSPVQTQYLTYQRQRLRDTEFNRATAESIIWAKLHNQHAFLQNWTRQYTFQNTDPTIKRTLNYLELLMDNLSVAPSINELHEYIHEADSIHYSAIAYLLAFHNQCPHITTKQINKFLTLGHQLLHQYVYTHLQTAGLHPDYGILYCDRDRELPLAWDLSGEFRAPIVDDMVLHFTRHLANNNGNGKKSYTLIQRFLQHWEGKLKTFVLHPYAGEVTYRQCIDLQVKEYISSLIGDVEYYRPLALKFHPNPLNFTNIAETQKPILTLVK